MGCGSSTPEVNGHVPAHTAKQEEKVARENAAKEKATKERAAKEAKARQFALAANIKASTGEEISLHKKLMDAAKAGDTKAVIELLDSGAAIVNIRDRPDGGYKLHHRGYNLTAVQPDGGYKLHHRGYNLTAVQPDGRTTRATAYGLLGFSSMGSMPAGSYSCWPYLGWAQFVLEEELPPKSITGITGSMPGGNAPVGPC
eukprot:gene4471-14630_t